MTIAAIVIGVVQVILLAQAVKNRKLFSRLEPASEQTVHPPVSVCLPMRDEQANAKRLLDSLLESINDATEIVVLDDGSSDDTPNILRSFEQQYPQRIRVIEGKPKPDDWRAKIWAMQQLSDAAGGEILVFIDADVRLSSGALASLLSAAEQSRADFYSIFPKQITTRSTDLLVDHVFTTLLHLLPMQFVPDPAYPSAVAGCGQVQYVRRKALSTIGGYESLRGSLHDGLHTARLVKRSGGTVGFAYGADMVSCEMYASFREAWQGFTRNAFQASGSLIALVLTSGLLIAAFVAAPVMLLNKTSALILGLPTIALYLHYVLLSKAFSLRRDFVIRLPLSVLLSSVLQWWSYLKNKLGLRTNWRGRAA